MIHTPRLLFASLCAAGLLVSQTVGAASGLPSVRAKIGASDDLVCRMRDGPSSPRISCSVLTPQYVTCLQPDDTRVECTGPNGIRATCYGYLKYTTGDNIDVHDLYCAGAEDQPNSDLFCSLQPESEPGASDGAATCRWQANNYYGGIPIVDPLSVDFGPVTVGDSSAVRTVNLRIEGAGTYRYYSAGTDASDFEVVSTTCPVGADLATGYSCTYTLRFTPVILGDVVSNFTISSTFGSNITVALRGRGVEPSAAGLIVTQPAALSFGSLPLGTRSADSVVRITNVGGSATTVGTISVSPPFALSSNSCPPALDAGLFCSVGVTYAPSVAGIETGELRVPWGTSAIAVVPLEGQGTPAEPTVIADPSVVSFGGQRVLNSSAPQTVTLRNLGPGSAAIAPRITDPAFFVSASDCPSSLAAAASCTVSVVFAPDVPGNQRAGLFHNATAATAVAQLSGVGTAPGVGVPSATPTSLVFAPAVVGSVSAEQSITLTNQGSGALAIDSIQTDSTSFGVRSDCPLSLAPSATCAIFVRFQPTTLGSLGGFVRLAHTGGSIYAIPVEGVGTAPPVTTATATVSVALSRDSVAVFDAVTATVRLTSDSGSPSGEVFVSDGTSGCSVKFTAVGAREGNCMLEPVYSGIKTVSARYAGDAVFSPAIGTAPLRVTKLLPVVTVTPSISSATINDPVTFTVSVTHPRGTPGGRVLVSDGQQVCDFLLPGTACVLRFALDGSKTVVARYLGDDRFETGAASTALVVGTPINAIALTVANNPSVFGDTLEATISVSPPISSGSVELKLADRTVCTVPGSGGSCRFVASGAGVQSLVAIGLNAAKTPIASASTLVTVNKASPILTFDLLPGATNVGTPVNARATLRFAAGAPTGEVRIVDTSSTCRYDLPAAGCQLIPTAAGTRDVRALYSGDDNFVGVEGLASLSVLPRLASVSVTSSSNPVAFRQNLTFTARVSGATPTGTATFFDGAATICADVALIGGVANCPRNDLSIGSHTIRVRYSGDANNGGAFSGTLNQIISGVTANVSVTLSTTNIVLGERVTAVATVDGGGPLPSGQVVVSDGSASCTIVFPATTCDLRPTRVGIRTVSARPAVRSNFLCAARSGVLRVERAPTTAVVRQVSPTGILRVGDAVSVEAAIATVASAGIVSGGSVSINAVAGVQTASCIATVIGGVARCSITPPTAGTYQITARYLGNHSYRDSASPARVIDVLSSNTARIDAIGGSNQITLANTAFALPLRVRVVDLAGKPLAGTAVRFVVPATGASATISPETVTTDAAGEATASAVANALSGAYTVSAEAAGGAIATFRLTNVPNENVASGRIEFGVLALGDQSDVSLYRFTNSSGESVTLGTPAMAFNGPQAADFVADAATTTCVGGLTLNPGAVCSAGLRFRPNANGLAAAQVTITAIGTLKRVVANIALSGRGSCKVLNRWDSDCDGAPDDVEVVEGLIPSVKDNDVFTNERWFVQQVYRDFFAREGDPGGVNFWAGQIASKQRTRAEVIEQGFIGSGEYGGIVAPVIRLYRTYFLRFPDMPGLEFWLQQARGGATTQSISDYFAISPEFQARYGSLNDAEFVELVYRNVLGREAEPGGRQFWIDELTTGRRTRGNVMNAFAQSPEYIQKTSAEVMVTTCYAGMLRRQPDPSGFAYWVSQVNAGASLGNLLNSFIASPEYRSRFLP